MWIAIGPFDGEVIGDSSFQSSLFKNIQRLLLTDFIESKLLKPNTSYTVGRKDRPLLVNNKKISHDHCDFVVGPHTVEDVVGLPFLTEKCAHIRYRVILPSGQR